MIPGHADTIAEEDESESSDVLMEAHPDISPFLPTAPSSSLAASMRSSLFGEAGSPAFWHCLSLHPDRDWIIGQSCFPDALSCLYDCFISPYAYNENPSLWENALRCGVDVASGARQEESSLSGVLIRIALGCQTPVATSQQALLITGKRESSSEAIWRLAEPFLDVQLSAKSKTLLFWLWLLEHTHQPHTLMMETHPAATSLEKVLGATSTSKSPDQRQWALKAMTLPAISSLTVAMTVAEQLQHSVMHDPSTRMASLSLLSDLMTIHPSLMTDDHKLWETPVQFLFSTQLQSVKVAIHGVCRMLTHLPSGDTDETPYENMLGSLLTIYVRSPRDWDDVLQQATHSGAPKSDQQTKDEILETLCAFFDLYAAGHQKELANTAITTILEGIEVEAETVTMVGDKAKLGLLRSMLDAQAWPQILEGVQMNLDQDGGPTVSLEDIQKAVS